MQTLLEHPKIERVLVMPAWLNPFKEVSHATAAQRLAWCRRVLDLPGVEVCDWEICQERPVYTIETWRHLRAEGIPLRYLVIGSDNLPTLRTWKAFESLNEEAIWLVITREGSPVNLEDLQRAETIPVEVPVSSTSIRQGVGLEFVDPRIIDEVKAVYHLT
jgi:nicotinate-nucleotide adenylyltransferase